MAQKQVNGKREKAIFNALSDKLNSHFRFCAILGKPDFLLTKREKGRFFLVTSKKATLSLKGWI